MWLSARPPPKPHQMNRGPDSKKLMESEGKPDHSQDHSRPGHPDGEPSHVESPGLPLVGEVGVVQPVLVGDARREGLPYLGGAAEFGAPVAGLLRRASTAAGGLASLPVVLDLFLPLGFCLGRVRCGALFRVCGPRGCFLEGFPCPSWVLLLGRASALVGQLRQGELESMAYCPLVRGDYTAFQLRIWVFLGLLITPVTPALLSCPVSVNSHKSLLSSLHESVIQPVSPSCWLGGTSKSEVGIFVPSPATGCTAGTAVSFRRAPPPAGRSPAGACPPEGCLPAAGGCSK